MAFCYVVESSVQTAGSCYQQEQEEEEVRSAELIPFEKEMNENPLSTSASHGKEDDEEESDTMKRTKVTELDPMIVACPRCSGFDRFSYSFIAESFTTQKSKPNTM